MPRRFYRKFEQRSEEEVARRVVVERLQGYTEPLCRHCGGRFIRDISASPMLGGLRRSRGDKDYKKVFVPPPADKVEWWCVDCGEVYEEVAGQPAGALVVD
jgi:hypothetical protein